MSLLFPFLKSAKNPHNFCILDAAAIITYMYVNYYWSCAGQKEPFALQYLPWKMGLLT
jgi:hypothetical protein